MDRTDRQLPKSDATIIVITVFAAWFLGSVLYSHDWARSLGSSIWSILLGVGLVGTLNKRRARRQP